MSELRIVDPDPSRREPSVGAHSVRDQEYLTYQAFGWLFAEHSAKSVQRWVNQGLILGSRVGERPCIHRSQIEVMRKLIEDEMKTGKRVQARG